MSKELTPAPEDIKTNLEFKKQEEFFEAIYQYFREYQEEYANYYINTKAGTKAFASLIKLISAAKGQLCKVLDLEELEKHKLNIRSLIIEGENTKARNELDKLSTIIFQAFEKLGISPTIHIDKDIISNFWKEEEHAGMREMKKAFFDSFMLPEE